MKLSKNLVSLNVLRILAGFFVIFLHTTDPFLLFDQYIGGSSWWFVYLLNTLAKVAVPIFVMLSGYLLFRPEKIGSLMEFYSKRVRRVGTPLLLWLVILFFWKAYWLNIPITLEYIVKTLITVDIGPLYFLVVILELYLITPMLYRLVYKNGKIKFPYILGFLVFSILTAFIPFYFFQNKFSFSQNIITIALPYIFYFVLGGYLRSKSYKRKYIFIPLVVYLGLGLLTIYLAKGDLSSIFTSYFSPTIIIMSFCLFYFVTGFEKRISSTINKTFKKYITYFSKTILGIFLIHPYILDILKAYTKLTPGNIYSPLWVTIFAIVLLVFTVCLLLVAVGKKIPVVSYLFD